MNRQFGDLFRDIFGYGPNARQPQDNWRPKTINQLSIGLPVGFYLTTEIRWRERREGIDIIFEMQSD